MRMGSTRRKKASAGAMARTAIDTWSTRRAGKDAGMATPDGLPALGGCPGNHGVCGERSRGCERRARSSLLRRAFRHASSVVAALAALAPRLVRLAHHDYPDRLLGARGAEVPQLGGEAARAVLDHDVAAVAQRARVEHQRLAHAVGAPSFV